MIRQNEAMIRYWNLSSCPTSSILLSFIKINKIFVRNLRKKEITLKISELER